MFRDEKVIIIHRASMNYGTTTAKNSPIKIEGFFSNNIYTKKKPIIFLEQFCFSFKWQAFEKKSIFYTSR
jgi:hypothetical protein